MKKLKKEKVLIREGKPPIPYPILSLEENYQNNGILFDKRIDYESLTILILNKEVQYYHSLNMIY